jgi:lysine 2,3-aminomutase
MEQSDGESLHPPQRWGKQRCFSHIPDEQWNDWRWQLRHRVTTLEELSRFARMTDKEKRLLEAVLRDFRMGITPYYLSLIDFDDPRDPIMRQSVPRPEEYLYREVGEEDPLAEEELSPVPGLTHRYPDRVLMVVSNTCAMYCRHCTRKRIMISKCEDPPADHDVDRMVDYIARTPTVRDVIISGGDPLTFSTEKLERILAKVRAVPHVQVIRIGSRVPVTMPQRVDDELCAMLEKYHPVWMNVHFNHPRECTPEAVKACSRLLRAGIPLNNQSVLLAGVNDNVETMRELVHNLMRMRVRPYYLFQCDPVRGTEHLRTSVAKGIEIVGGLRGYTSGLGVPAYVIDAPGGGGKVPVGPDYLLYYNEKEGRAVLRNFHGKVIEYHDPLSAEALSRMAVSSLGKAARSSGDETSRKLPSRRPHKRMPAPAATGQS